MGMVTLWILAAVSALFLGEFFVIYHLYRKALTRRSDKPKRRSKPIVPFREKVFMSRDGLRLKGWYVPAPNAKAVVILAHRYDAPGARIDMLPWAEFLCKNGYAVFLFDFRAHGESEGEHVSLGIKEWMDLEAAYRLMEKMPEHRGKKIGFLGRSMGAATTIITMGRVGIGDFAILNVPFANFDRLAHFRMRQLGYSWLPFHTLFQKLTNRLTLGLDYHSYEPERLMKKIHVPVFIIWSDPDEYVGPRQGSVIYEAANGPKEAWHMSFGHDAGERGKGEKEFQQKVKSFLDQVTSHRYDKKR
jgi:uncharacterized protein